MKQKPKKERDKFIKMWTTATCQDVKIFLHLLKKRGYNPPASHKSPGRTRADVAQIQTSASEIYIHFPAIGDVKWLPLCLTGKFPGRSIQKLPHLRRMCVCAAVLWQTPREQQQFCAITQVCRDFAGSHAMRACALLLKKGNACTITSLSVYSSEAEVFEAQSIPSIWRDKEAQLSSLRRLH